MQGVEDAIDQMNTWYSPNLPAAQRYRRLTRARGARVWRRGAIFLAGGVATAAALAGGLVLYRSPRFRRFLESQAAENSPTPRLRLPRFQFRLWMIFVLTALVAWGIVAIPYWVTPYWVPPEFRYRPDGRPLLWNEGIATLVTGAMAATALAGGLAVYRTPWLRRFFTKHATQFVRWVRMRIPRFQFRLWMIFALTALVGWAVVVIPYWSTPYWVTPDTRHRPDGRLRLWNEGITTLASGATVAATLTLGLAVYRSRRRRSVLKDQATEDRPGVG
jgi:hypothetical protein